MDKMNEETTNTWKRDLEKEMEATSFKYSWKEMKTSAQDRA